VQSLLEKLGVRSDLTIALVGVTDREFCAEVRAAVPETYEHVIPKGTEMILLQAETRDGLATTLADVGKLLRPDGGIWVLWPKGRMRLTKRDVMRAGAAAGLVDVKTIDFSDVFSALKLVVPAAGR
jgi:hypothetical protein